MFEVTAACKYEIGDNIAGTNILHAIILAIHMSSSSPYVYVLSGGIYSGKTLCF